MLKLALLFAALALAAGVYGFGAASAVAVLPARLLCFGSLVAFAVSFAMAMTPTAFRRVPAAVPATVERR
ncbi:hypothetical protein [Derxia lacustris]|uniref:hypothetical protein n=1 Tax=Derxia lacustris TaxID=764842 RepID=UPI000A16ED42|nr:hypothetical protein [Derxia lacustris]